MMPIIEERVPMSWISEVMQRRRLGWFFTLVDAVLIDREALIDRALLELKPGLGVDDYDALLDQVPGSSGPGDRLVRDPDPLGRYRRGDLQHLSQQAIAARVVRHPR